MLCPLRLSRAEQWSVRPCASADGGSFAISVNGVERAQSITRPWIAAGARIRIAWSPREPILMALDGGLLFPLVRDELKVDPALSIFRTPAASLLGRFSLGVLLL
jgi:hypothetical protein